MKLKTHRLGEYGLLLTLGVFAAAWFLQLAGVFHSTDQAFLDASDRFKTKEPLSQPVLLVYTSSDMLEQDDSRLIDLIQFLDQSDAKRIGIVAEKSLPQVNAIEQLDCSDQVVLGQSAEQILTQSNDRLQRGFIDLQLDGQPVYRQHTTTLATQRRVLESFERIILKDSEFGNSPIPHQEFGVQFSGSVETIPHVNAEDIFAGKIISELIEGKIVLIGKRMDRQYGFVTPSTRGSERMTRLELHGHILNTLLRSNFRQPPSIANLAMILALFCFAVCQLARQTSNLWMPQAFVACCGVIVLTGWITLTFFSIQLPISAMAFCVVASFTYSALYRFRILHLAADYWRLMMDLDQRELESSPDKAWDLLTEAVLQMFYPKKMVLMELQPNATHLSVVSTINCEPEDIFEKRRDAQRIPYRDAIALEQPLNVKQRCFFHKEPIDTEIEYMVPIMFSSQLLGFMVIAMDSVALEKWKDFENFLGQFANDMSIVIAKYRNESQKKTRRRVPVHQLKQLPEEKTLERIKSEKLEQQNQIQRLNSAFERSESAMAICDVFGRILRANSRLVRLLQDIEVVTGETSCVEMIAKLTTRPVNDCRRVFQLAIMNNRANQLCIPPTADRPYPSIMFVKPLSCTSHEADGDINYRRVVIEIIEGRSFEVINNWQNQLTDNICQNANDQVRQLRTQLRELQRDGLSDDRLDQVVHSLGKSLGQVQSTISRCQEVVQNQLTEEPENCFPIQTLEIYRSAFQHFEQVLEGRNIEIVHDVDDDDCVGIANPFLLEKTFLVIMDLLSENAFDHSQLFISAQTVGDKINFQFRNRGGGTPLQGLRKSLVNDDELVEDESGTEQPCYLAQDQLDRLAEIQEWLEEWDGSLRIANLADYSLNIELTLMNESSDFPGKTGKVQEKSQTPRS